MDEEMKLNLEEKDGFQGVWIPSVFNDKKFWIMTNNHGNVDVKLENVFLTKRTTFHFLTKFCKPLILEALKERLKECKWEVEVFGSKGPLSNLTGAVPQRKLYDKIWSLEYVIRYLEENFE